jgi:malic enzyme
MSGVHRNGKIEIVGRVRLQDAEDLARHYTPGVAELDRPAANPAGRVG